MAPSRRAVLAVMARSLLAGWAGPKSVTSGSRVWPAPAPGATAVGIPATTPSVTAPTAGPAVTRAEIVARYRHAVPHTWGFEAPGVAHALPSRNV